MITLDGLALRQVADALDALARIEGETGVRMDGGHYGHAMAEIVAGPDDAREHVRVVRVEPLAEDGHGTYALEFEVP